MEDCFLYYENGKRALLSKKYSEAKENFLEFLKYKNNFADVYNFMGYIAYIDGDNDTSISYYTKALELNPKYTEALMNISVILHSMGRFDEAEKYLEYLQKPTHSEGIADHFCRGKLANKHVELAEIYFSLMLYDGALEEYRKAISLCPDFPDIRLKYGITLRESGHIEESINEFNHVLEIKNNYAEAYIHIGLSYYKLGYVGYALEAWQKGYLIDSNNRLIKSYMYLINGAKEFK